MSRVVAFASFVFGKNNVAVSERAESSMDDARTRDE